MSQTDPKVHVIMAVYRPDMPVLERQIASILGQKRCHVSLTMFADGPMDQLPALRELAARHKNIALVPFERNCGPAVTFLEGLAQIVEELEPQSSADFFAFADQDDVWNGDKLALSADTLRSRQVGAIHTDARVVDGQLNILAPSLHALENRHREPSLVELFFRNNATGMTMLFDPVTARTMVQLRQFRPEAWLHDHFGAFVAASGKGLAYLDRPLVDYVQHEANAVGAMKADINRAPSGGFRDPAGKSAILLEQGASLVTALQGPAPGQLSAQAQLQDLARLLESRGLAGLWRAASVLRSQRPWPRALFARLFWSKLFG